MRGFINFPLTRLVIYGAACSALMIGLLVIQKYILHAENAFRIPWFNFLSAAAFLALYGLLVRVIEQRTPTETGRGGLVHELAAGMAVEGLLCVAMVGILAAWGAYTITATHIPAGLAVTISYLVFVAIQEEIGFRGIIFRNVEELIGSWGALVISGALFGAIHLANDNATWSGAIGIALESSLLDGGLYMITRRLWIVIGAHFAWDFLEGPVFGVRVSGFDFQSFIVSHLAGPQWLTGGAFGPEAAIPTMGISVLAGAAAVAVAHHKGRFMRPLWLRNLNHGIRHPRDIS